MTTKITMIEGNDVSINLTVTTLSSGVARDITGSTILFTVKSDINDEDVDAIISKDIINHSDPVNGITNIPISREDTIGKYGFHQFDIQIDESDGNRSTLQSGIFVITQSIGDREI